MATKGVNAGCMTEIHIYYRYVVPPKALPPLPPFLPEGAQPRSAGSLPSTQDSRAQHSLFTIN